MTDPAPAASATDLGVVEPLQMPGVAGARRLWSSLPPVGRIFVALSAIDVVVRALNLFGTGLFLAIELPLTWLTAFLPHNALILLPAAIAWRRPNAFVELPLVTRGAIVVALVELLRTPLGEFVAQLAVNDFLVPVVVSMATAVATAAGWIAIGRGIRAFTPATSTESLTGLANLVGGALVVAAVGGAVLGIFVNADMGDPGWNALIRLNAFVISLSGLGLAYLAGVTVRGTNDPARPPAATKVATASFVGLAAGALLILIGGEGPIWTGIFLITHTAAWTGLVVAFALGLADPEDRTAPEPVAEQDDGPAWPEPGGATPTFHEPGVPRID